MIQSQNILNSDSTSIAYKELTEVAKFVVFKDSATAIFKYYRSELDKQSKISEIKQLKIDQYFNNIVPDLKKIIIKKDSIILNDSYLLEISETKLKSQKSKKWSWLAIGGAVGVVIASLIGN